MGPNSLVDLSIALKAGTSDEQITDFLNDVLGQPSTPPKTGVAFLPGMASVDVDYGNMRIYVMLECTVEDQQKQYVIARARSSPLVQDIEERVKPLPSE